MKTMCTFCFIGSLLGTAAYAQRAQNTDFSFLVGAAANTSGSVTPNTNGTIPTVTGSVGVAMQQNFGYQVAVFSKGSLYVEIPVVFVWHGSGTVSGAAGAPAVTSIDNFAWYVLPGVRWRIPTGTRI